MGREQASGMQQLRAVAEEKLRTEADLRNDSLAFLDNGLRLLECLQWGLTDAKNNVLGYAGRLYKQATSCRHAFLGT